MHQTMGFDLVEHIDRFIGLLAVLMTGPLMSRPATRDWHLSVRNFYSAATTAHPPFPGVAPDGNDLLNKLRVLAVRGNLKEALYLFYNSPPPPPSYSHQTYSTLFQTCARHGYLQQGQSLHHHMLVHNPDYQPDLIMTNHLINMYAKCGDLALARQLFDEMPMRNAVSWSSLISGYAQHGHCYECFRLLADMLAHNCPNEFSISSVLACCDYERGRQLHGLALKLGLDAVTYIGNALITMYNNCHLDGSAGGRDEAWTVFETMEFRNLVTWNSMISGLQFRKHGAEAVSLFRQMHARGIGFDRATLLSVFSSLWESYDYDYSGVGLKFCSQLHCLTIKSGSMLSIEVATALVKAYSNLRGPVSDCYRIFLETDGLRDIVSWTGIMTALAEREPEESLFLFRQLLREEIAPDWYTYSTVLKACAGIGTEGNALAVHAQVIKAGFEGDTVLTNALVHAYARCGSISLSKQVFDGIRFRDLVSWNVMIKAYALHGLAKEALHLFSQMDLQPDSATMVSLLSACSHAGFVEEGIKIFDSMSVNHGIYPQLDHYACMVDILGRAGRIFEAKEFIDKMPMEPDFVVWSALLGSCRKHGDTELAKLAAEKLMELDPGNSLGYIQMSNIYCSGGSYNEAGLIRQEMEGSKLRKEPGLSWMEIGNRVHEFASGGRRHPQREAICAELDVLIGKLKEIGYVPETSLTLLDIEEENKEQLLYHHSEKLALVFAMMNESSPHCGGGSVIRIMKNIRICLDCHNFMKLASDLLQKEIVVRDSNRFHHFKNRTCSCNDYW